MLESNPIGTRRTIVTITTRVVTIIAMDHEVNIETIRHDINPLVKRTTRAELVVKIGVMQDAIAVEATRMTVGIEADMRIMFPSTETQEVVPVITSLAVVREVAIRAVNRARLRVTHRVQVLLVVQVRNKRFTHKRNPVRRNPGLIRRRPRRK